MNKRELFQNNTARLGATFLPTTTPILMYGVLLFFFGIALYLCGVALVVPRYFLGLNRMLYPISEGLVWYSGIPVTLGIGAVAFDLLSCSPISASMNPSVPSPWRTNGSPSR